MCRQESTWEPVTHLKSCNTLLRSYNLRKGVTWSSLNSAGQELISNDNNGLDNRQPEKVVSSTETREGQSSAERDEKEQQPREGVLMLERTVSNERDPMVRARSGFRSESCYVANMC